MTEQNNNNAGGGNGGGVSRDIVAVLERLARIESRLDMIIERHAERIDITEREIRDMSLRVDALERQRDIEAGRNRIISALIAAASSAAVAVAVKFLTSGIQQ